VANERLIRRLQRVDAVRQDLASFLERLGVAIRAGIANLRRGVPVSEQTRDATDVHVELVQKLDDMHHAVHEARAEGVRVLVEDEGLPVSTVAQLMGRPRQLVSRLYQQARNGRGERGTPPGNGARSGNGGADRARRPDLVGGRSGVNRSTKLPPAAR
jgi:hypothetical protein